MHEKNIFAGSLTLAYLALAQDAQDAREMVGLLYRMMQCQKIHNREVSEHESKRFVNGKCAFLAVR